MKRSALNSEDTGLLVKALNRAISRHKSCAKSTDAGYSAKNNQEIVRKMSGLRDRILQAYGVVVVEE